MLSNAGRAKSLEQLHAEACTLLSSLNQSLLYASDPLERARLRKQLDQATQQVEQYEAEMESLNQAVTGPQFQTTASQPPHDPAQAISSPFIVAGHLTNQADFIGRSRERSTLTQRSYNGLSTSLVGARRIGKTWLMDYLGQVAPQEFGSRHMVVYLDASLDSCRTIAGFVYQCLNGLNLTAQVASPSELRLNALENAVRELKARNRVPVLCLDEFERFGRANQHEFDLNFFEGLRGIAGLGAALVTASKIPLIELVSQIGNTSPFFNIFETVRVQAFTGREARKFVEAKAALVGLDALEQAKLLELAARPGSDRYEPLRLQLVGELLYRDKRLALHDDPDLYRPADPTYWQEFSDELEDKYQGMVQP